MRWGFFLSFSAERPSATAARKGRFLFEERDGVTRVEIARREGLRGAGLALFTLVFLAVWAPLFSAPALAGLRQNGPSIFVVSWLAVASAMALLLAYGALWQLFGRETFVVTEGASGFRQTGRRVLTITRSLLGVHRSRSFDVATMGELEAVERRFKCRGGEVVRYALGFHYEGEAVQSYPWLDFAEATYLLQGPLGELGSHIR